MVRKFEAIRGWLPPAFLFILWLVFWVPLKFIWLVLFQFALMMIALLIPDKHYDEVRRQLLMSEFNPIIRNREERIKYYR